MHKNRAKVENLVTQFLTLLKRVINCLAESIKFLMSIIPTNIETGIDKVTDPLNRFPLHCQHNIVSLDVGSLGHTFIINSQSKTKF